MKRALILLLFLSAHPAYGAEPLGRLFYTPAQRAQLDVLRSQKHIAPPAAEPEQPATIPETVRYDGIVRRNDGTTTVWINNHALPEGKPAGELPISARVRADHRLSITVPQIGKSVELKVGQSAELVSGSITEPYARPQADAQPQRAAPVAAKPAPAPPDSRRP